ncbi:MAG: HEPN domain-containing protein [Candidatus Margulisiibacteriota bacterium]
MDQLLREWIRYAETDLKSAELQMDREGLYHISVYQSHQAVEKIIKAYLVQKKIEEVPKVHDLRKLVIFSKQFGLDLSSQKMDILELDSFFPKLRYPFGDEISSDDAHRCFKIAFELVEMIKSSMNRNE